VLRAALRAAPVRSLPFQRGLLALQHGRCLRALGENEAASMLRGAHDTFSALGAEPFRRASQAELAGLEATGARFAGRAGRPVAGPQLTAQELRVAQLVASGLSNREAAAKLFLSPKTVEYHLAHAFTKLGVRSRHQLGTRIRDAEAG
jgi:DNA-binding CsgD family transcriptional regulator